MDFMIAFICDREFKNQWAWSVYLYLHAQAAYLSKLVLVGFVGGVLYLIQRDGISKTIEHPYVLFPGVIAVTEMMVLRVVALLGSVLLVLPLVIRKLAAVPAERNNLLQRTADTGLATAFAGMKNILKVLMNAFLHVPKKRLTRVYGGPSRSVQ